MQLFASVVEAPDAALLRLHARGGFTELVQAGGEVLLRLVNDILDESKIEAAARSLLRECGL